MNDLAHAYVGTLMSSRESDWRSEHFHTLKSLHSKNSIVITRPDKGSVVVILDYQCYVNKMMSIIGDTFKFLRLGPVNSYNHTTSIETKFQRSWLNLSKEAFSPWPSWTSLDPLVPYNLVFMDYQKPIKIGYH